MSLIVNKIIFYWQRKLFAMNYSTNKYDQVIFYPTELSPHVNKRMLKVMTYISTEFFLTIIAIK